MAGLKREVSAGFKTKFPARLQIIGGLVSLALFVLLIVAGSSGNTIFVAVAGILFFAWIYIAIFIAKRWRKKHQ